MTDKPAKEGRFEMRVDKAWLKKLDRLRREWPDDDLPTRTEAVRRLIEEMYEQRVSDAA
jgi:hypothetical protein